MDNNDSEKHSRREILQAGAMSVLAANALAACGSSKDSLALPQPSQAQRRLKRKEKSRVYIAPADGYENLAASLAEAWKAVGPAVKDRSIFIKVNLVDFRKDVPVCTNAALLDAALALLKAAGAGKIKVGDGPALSRDTEELARLSGMAEVCRRHKVEFVDLNIDDLEEVENPLKFTGIDAFVLPQSVTKSDMVISMPKLKTHHWALLTCSMKNMFGVVPGRKYGWPKNILHIRGIDRSIIDINAAVKPAFAIVDGVVAMEGDGPLNGKARNLNVLVLGDDLTAVDTVSGLCLELPVHKIPYLKMAGLVLGNNDLQQIDLSGAAIDSVKQKFLLPPTYEEDGTPKDPSKLSKGAETGVT